MLLSGANNKYTIWQQFSFLPESLTQVFDTVGLRMFSHMNCQVKKIFFYNNSKELACNFQLKAAHSFANCPTRCVFVCIGYCPTVCVRRDPSRPTGSQSESDGQSQLGTFVQFPPMAARCANVNSGRRSPQCCSQPATC